MTKKYPLEFEKLFNFTRNFSKMCGVDVVKENYKRTWWTWVIFALLNSAIGISFYTIYLGVVVNKDWTDILKCLCTLGKGFQGYVKLVNGLLRPGLVRFIYLEINDIYLVYEHKSANYHKLLRDSIVLVKKLLGLLLSSVILVTLAMICIPFIYIIFLNKRIAVIHFFFPYIDYETDFGYYFTTVVHVICVVFAIFGNFVNDSWCFVFAAHIPLMKNIQRLKFKELDGVFEDEVKDLKMAKVKLFDILKWHQKYIRFCNAIEDLFFWVIFVQIATEFVNIVCTIVCIFMGVWPAAPVYLVYSFFSLYIHCALGNLVQISNDELTVIIYDSCWYNLTVSQQKLLLLMLRKSQQTKGMSIGGVAPLSMNTALQLTKTIYTFSMMLQRFLNK